MEIIVCVENERRRHEGGCEEIKGREGSREGNGHFESSSS